MEQIETIWKQVLVFMQSRISSPIGYNTWVKTIIPYKIDMDNGDFIVRVERNLNREMIQAKYQSMIETGLESITDMPLKLVILSDEEMNSASEEGKAAKNPNIPANLNPRYVFDSFVVGNSNRLAHAAALAVAKSPANAYNPLFLYGNVGLGKTHLMHSIAHYILEHNPDSKVLYASSETFTNELINSIRDHKNEEFRNKYRKIDVLLIDDIQFIAQKDMTQEEFFHTFNTLHESNKQIIISSDRPPKEIKTLEERLRSRFEWGLIADIQPPDYETRIAILQKKASSENLRVPDSVMEFIAQKIVSNIRELEGALTRTVAYGNLTGKVISPELAEAALKNIFNEKTVLTLTPELIQDVVAKYYGITSEDIRGAKKPKNIVYPRQIAMYLARKHLDISLPRIGETFGGRDHTTVIHACSKIERELETDNDLIKTIGELEERISQR